MSENKLIKTVYMDCPICDKTHNVELRKRIATTIIKGDTVSYPETYFHCENTKDDECDFETAKMTDENLLNARNSYRKMHDLLTSDEIIQTRKSYRLSQVDLAQLMGWGEATISRYETKSIQDEAHDAMLRLVRDNPLVALEFLQRNREKFSHTKFLEIKEQITEQLDSHGKEFLSRQALKGDYARFEDPSDFNGFKSLDIDKIEVAISYFAQKVENLFKVKLMKMLWYADVQAFKDQNHAITGLVYQHEPMGALPIGHNDLMNLENVNVTEKQSYNFSSMFHFHPIPNADYSILSQEEKDILDVVVKKFRTYSTEEIVDYMHEEKAYLNTEPNAIIPFSLAKDIRPLN